MVRIKNTARKCADRRAPRRPIVKAKPHPKDKFILKWLYYAIEHQDENLLDLILTFPRFGKVNLLHAIDVFFDNLSLSGEIVDFFDWKWKTDSLEQDHEHVGNYSKSGFDDTFGHGTPLLFYAIQKGNTNMLKKLVQFAPGIDVHKPMNIRLGHAYLTPNHSYPYECADDNLEKQIALFGKQGFYYALSRMKYDSNSKISLLFENKEIDFIYVVKTCLMKQDMKTVKHILQIVPEPALSWIKQNGLPFILQYCDDSSSALETFEQLVESHKIDLTPCSPSINFNILTSIFVSGLTSSEQIEQLNYLFSKGFEITPEVGTFATELRYRMSRELFHFIQSKLSICPGPPLKKRKLS